MQDSSSNVLHLAFIPSAGMGHLTPCLRFAALFLRQPGCHVTLITPKPTVSDAESLLISRFCSSFPVHVTHIDFHVIPLDPSSGRVVNSSNPFWLQFEATRRSCHLLTPILSSLSPPLSAVVFDVSLVSPLIPVTRALGLPAYIYFIAAARMFAFFSHLAVLAANSGAEEPHGASFIGDKVEIPGIGLPVPRSSVPPLLLVPNSLFEKIFLDDSPRLRELDGIFINTFDEIEGEALAALNDGKVLPGLPPVHALGPLMPGDFDKSHAEGKSGNNNSPMKWLDAQPSRSVMYVCFGNRTPTTIEQTKEMAKGLMRSGFRFLWVVKLKMVDREDEQDLEEVLGQDIMQEMKENPNKGLVVKTWVDQNEILGHPSIGGFMSHGGWNSTVESLWHGVPILSWAQHGDQKISSEVVAASGVGVRPEWGWGEERLVKGEEIAKAVKEMMSNESVRVKALELKDASRKAARVGGSSEAKVKTLIQEWKEKKKN